MIFLEMTSKESTVPKQPFAGVLLNNYSQNSSRNTFCFMALLIINWRFVFFSANINLKFCYRLIFSWHVKVSVDFIFLLLL